MYYWTRYGDSFIKEKPYFYSGRHKIIVDFFLLSTPKTSKWKPSFDTYYEKTANTWVVAPVESSPSLSGRV